MNKIELTPFQRNLFEKVLTEKNETEKAQEELLSMIFSFHKTERPTTQLNYNNGVLSWVKNEEPVEG
jgi:hypothetical protein